MERWRVFYTASRAEKSCEQKIQDLGLEVFLPKITVKRQWKDRIKRVTEPLFRSYIFAHVSEKERLEILGVNGIVRTLAFGGLLAEMRTEEIEQLKITQNDPALLALAGPWLPRTGQKVIVTEGPMKGLTGEVLQHRGQSYIVIGIEAIRQAVRVNVPVDWVEAIDESLVLQ